MKWESTISICPICERFRRTAAAESTYRSHVRLNFPFLISSVRIELRFLV